MSDDFRSCRVYDTNGSSAKQDACRKETEMLAILTGLEIDSAKSGIKPDLSEYLGVKTERKSLFLRYKSIVGDDDNNRKWYQPTVNARLKKYFAGVDWENVSSNLEKLPYYASEFNGIQIFIFFYNGNVAEQLAGLF